MGPIVPCHADFERIEKKDKLLLIMKGAVTPLVWPEPFCDLECMFFKVKSRKKDSSHEMRILVENQRTEVSQGTIGKL